MGLNEKKNRRSDVDERGRHTNIECAEQKQQLFRGMDSEQCEGGRLWYSAQRLENVIHIHRKLDGNPRDFQTHFGTVHRDVQTQSIFALVHRRGWVKWHFKACEHTLHTKFLLFFFYLVRLYAGMDEMEFTEAESNMNDLISEYQQYQVRSHHSFRL